MFLFRGYRGILDDHLSCTFNGYLRPGEAASDTNPQLNVGLGGGCSAHPFMKYHRLYHRFSHTDTVYRAKIWDQIFCFSNMSLPTLMYSALFGQCPACRPSPSFPYSLPDLYLKKTYMFQSQNQHFQVFQELGLCPEKYTGGCICEYSW